MEPTHSYLLWSKSDTTTFAHIPLARSHITSLATGGLGKTVGQCAQEEETGLMSIEPVSRNNYKRNTQKAVQTRQSSIVSRISDSNSLVSIVWTIFSLALESVPHLLTLTHNIQSVQFDCLYSNLYSAMYLFYNQPGIGETSSWPLSSLVCKIRILVLVS